jgi:DNA (cytosine-5)-methyltransferase 3A
MEPLTVLSLFDGISCGQVALERAGIDVGTYYSSEIDEKAMSITQRHYPNTVQLGNVLEWRSWDLPSIDLVMGGSPCQGFSTAGKRLNFEDSRSRLFFEFLEIVRELKPKFFLLENVVMRQEIQDAISLELGCQPVLIDSQTVSAQMRKRLYWTNIPNLSPPHDRGVLLPSILESDTDWRPASIYGRKVNLGTGKREDDSSLPLIQCVEVMRTRDKARCLTTISKDSVLTSLPIGRHPDAYGKHRDDWRTLTMIECERLQTLPDEYTLGIGETHRRHVLGNGWTVDVIVHILRLMTEEGQAAHAKRGLGAWFE